MINRRILAAATTVTTLSLAGCMATGGASSDDVGADDGRERLRVALTWVPTSGLSPYTDDATSLTRAGIAETLVRTDENGALKPGLAQKWTLTESSVTFTLRSGAVFHDGSPVNAETVKNSLDQALGASPTPQSLEGSQLTVTADGDKVTIASAAADPVLAQRFAFPSTMILAPAAFTTDAPVPNVVNTATGPFKLTAAGTTAGMTATAFDKHWGGKPKASGVDVKFISDPGARVSALRAGQIDIADNLPIAQLGQLSDSTVVQVTTPRVTGAFLGVNGPLADDGLRSTAAQALDSNVVVSTVFEGKANADRATLIGEQWKKVRPEITYPERRPAQGEKLTIATYSDRPELPATVSLVADQLRKAGFEVGDPVVKEYTVMEKDILNGTYDVTITSHKTVGGAGDEVSGLAKAFSCNGSWNPAKLCDPALDEAITKASTATGDERTALTAQAEALALSKATFVPLAHQNVLIGTNKKVTGLNVDKFDHRLISGETHR